MWGYGAVGSALEWHSRVVGSNPTSSTIIISVNKGGTTNFQLSPREEFLISALKEDIGVDKRYDFKAIEAKWQNIWKENKIFKVYEDKSKQNTIIWRCSPILPDICIWDMCVIMPLVM